MRPESYRIRRNNAKLGLLRRSRSFKVTEVGTNRKLICDFLLEINNNSPPTLHRLRDIAFDRSAIAIFGYPSCAQALPQTEGFPCEDIRKISTVKSTDGYGTKWRRNIAENFNRLSRVHESYRRHTTNRHIVHVRHVR